MRWSLVVAGVVGLVVVLAGGAAAVCKFTDARCGIRPSPEDASNTDLPNGFRQDVVLKGLQQPTDVAFLPDGQMLITEKAGRVLLVDRRNRIRRRPFLDLRPQVNDEMFRGVLTIQPDPGFARNGYVYVLYVRDDSGRPTGPRTVRLSRFTAKRGVARVDSERVILGRGGRGSCSDLPRRADCLPSEVDHVGGDIAFAPDGTMFVSTGDGGGLERAEKTAFTAQSIDALGGKVLHIDRNGNGLEANPFWNGDPTANRSKVWAIGFRNPFRMSLRPGSNVPYVGDVGNRTTEEVDVARRGANLGWPCYEGTQRQPLYEKSALCRRLYARGPGATQPPLISWGRDVGGSSTLGEFYTGGTFPPAYRGALLFGDFIGTWIRFVKLDSTDHVQRRGELAANAGSPVAIRNAPDGSIYYVSYFHGELRRISFGT